MKIAEVANMNVEITDHFKERIESRNINIDSVLYSLNEKRSILKYYNNTGLELCYNAGRLAFFFEVREGKIVLITALDKHAVHIKKGTVII
ncbi:MAG: hypothetical protein ACOC1O_02625 [bacterium]